jgi:hypothetical protein
MITITVSVNYSDILNVILPQNYKFFEKWYIITSPADKDTLDVIQKYNYANVCVVYYDFYRSGRKFDKGGAIRHCQKNYIPNSYNGLILILDSDIYLPDHFMEIINSIDVTDGTLYGTNARYDYYTYEHFAQNIIDFNYPWAREFQGYFQLYKYKVNFLYNESYNCAECDLNFLQHFHTKQILDALEVKHLGERGCNWNGRVDTRRFSV